MEKSINKNTAGVSLVEIMVSMLLVAIALVAITTVFPSMNKNRKGIHEADQAKMLATQVLEGLQYLSSDNGYNRGEFCDAIKSSPASCATFNSGSDDELANFCTAFSTAQAINSAVYTVTWEENKSCATLASDINTVSVKVAWTKSGKPHNVTVTGILR